MTAAASMKATAASPNFDMPGLAAADRTSAACQPHPICMLHREKYM